MMPSRFRLGKKRKQDFRIWGCEVIEVNLLGQ